MVPQHAAKQRGRGVNRADRAIARTGQPQIAGYRPVWIAGSDRPLIVDLRRASVETGPDHVAALRNQNRASRHRNLRIGFEKASGARAARRGDHLGELTDPAVDPVHHDDVEIIFFDVAAPGAEELRAHGRYGAQANFGMAAGACRRRVGESRHSENQCAGVHPQQMRTDPSHLALDQRHGEQIDAAVQHQPDLSRIVDQERVVIADGELDAINFAQQLGVKGAGVRRIHRRGYRQSAFNHRRLCATPLPPWARHFPKSALAPRRGGAGRRPESAPDCRPRPPA